MEWKQDTSRYLTFAENDDQWFSGQYNSGVRAPGMAFLGVSICERYLKHIIDQRYNPEADDKMREEMEIFRTHSVIRLIRFIADAMEIEVPKSLEHGLMGIQIFGYTAQYPGYNSIVPSARDIDEVSGVVFATRKFAYDVLQENKA